MIQTTIHYIARPKYATRPFGSRTSRLIAHDRFLNAAPVALTRAHAVTEPRVIKL